MAFAKIVNFFLRISQVDILIFLNEVHVYFCSIFLKFLISWYLLFIRFRDAYIRVRQKFVLNFSVLSLYLIEGLHVCSSIPDRLSSKSFKYYGFLAAHNIARIYKWKDTDMILSLFIWVKQYNLLRISLNSSVMFPEKIRY